MNNTKPVAKLSPIPAFDFDGVTYDDLHVRRATFTQSVTASFTGVKSSTDIDMQANLRAKVIGMLAANVCLGDGTQYASAKEWEGFPTEFVALVRAKCSDFLGLNRIMSIDAADEEKKS